MYYNHQGGARSTFRYEGYSNKKYNPLTRCNPLITTANINMGINFQNLFQNLQENSVSSHLCTNKPI